MNLDEYKEKIKEIEVRASDEKNLVAKEYALANNSILIGDIVEDHIGKVLVENISFAFHHVDRMPLCVYWGMELKKNGTPKISGNKRKVFQSNLIVKN
jgi:hypothetical protein